MARRIRSSRLSRYAEKQSKKQFIFFGLGTLIIIFLLIQFSGALLGAFGNIIFGIRGDETESSESILQEQFLAAPTLNGIQNATSSAQINIAGSSSYNEGKIILYVNEKEVDDISLDGSNNFEFKRIDLRNGENTINAKYFLDDKESDFSQDYSITRSSDKPELEISAPSDKSSFTKADKTITVSGKTDPNNSITVNGFRAIVDSEGEYSYRLELSEGENTITVEATNEAGIKTSKEIKVDYKE